MKSTGFLFSIVDTGFDLKGRWEMAMSIFEDTPLTVAADGISGDITNSQRSMKQKLSLLEKLRKNELSKWWEATALQKC